MTGPRLLVATRSEHKLRELRGLLSLDRADLVTLDQLGVDGDPVEDGRTFRTNAAIKARFGLRATGLPTLADDSGIEVDALAGGPGLHSARWGGPELDDDDRNALLLERLRGVPAERRTARYRCVIAIVEPGGREQVVEGAVEGRITEAPEGTGGFGYDPLFFYPPFGCTFGVASAADKHRVSHRGVAARSARALLTG